MWEFLTRLSHKGKVWYKARGHVGASGLQQHQKHGDNLAVGRLWQQRDGARVTSEIMVERQISSVWGSNRIAQRSIRPKGPGEASSTREQPQTRPIAGGKCISIIFICPQGAPRESVYTWTAFVSTACQLLMVLLYS